MTKPSPAKIDHISYLVQAGMLRDAQKFFYDIFGWEIIPERTVFSEERNIVFLRTGSPILLQLNTPNDWLPIPFVQSEHLAIKVENARETVNAIRAYFRSQVRHEKLHVLCTKANPDGTKWFVEIRELLAFNLELVTADS